jgi:hypothetical protein
MTWSQLPKIAPVACVLAFVMAILSAVSVLDGQILNLPFTLILLGSGIGILRGRAWSAYGLALLLGQVSGPTPPAGVIGAFAIAVLTIPLFVIAGRSLERAGAMRGWALPWIVTSVLCTVPLLFLQAFSIPTGAM